MIKKNTKSNRYKKIALAGAAVVILAGSALAVYHFNQPDTPKAPAGVKLAPATKQEKQEADQNKDRIAAQAKNSETTPAQPSTATPAGTKKQVSVIITHAGTDSVNAYVTGVFEDGGTCTATFTQGSTSVTRTSSGFANVSDTQCAPITPNLPSGGSWSVTVSYNSATATGQSQAQTF